MVATETFRGVRADFTKFSKILSTYFFVKSKLNSKVLQKYHNNPAVMKKVLRRKQNFENIVINAVLGIF